VAAVDTEHVLEVAAAEDEDPIETMMLAVRIVTFFGLFP
jgi:hypothetical protein